jgi:peptide/nickel transport system permease protein
MNEGRRGLAGWSARGLARLLDMLDAVPAIIVGLVLVALFGASGTTIVIAIGVVSLPRQAKLVRSAALKVRSDPYVDAARMAGASEHGILLGTVLPNSVRPALENVSAVFGIAITLEAALGFLGVGLPPPTPEWGAMIALGASEALNLRWWGATFPTLALILSVIAVSLAGGELLRRRT